MLKLFKTKQTRINVLAWVLLFPSLAIFVGYRIVPLLWNIVLSFMFWAPGKEAKYAGIYHYEEMLFYDKGFWVALNNTAVFMLATPIAIALAIGLALLVDQKIRGSHIYRTLIFLPYVIMVVAVGIVWRWLYNDNVGLINYVLRVTGIIDQPILFLESSQTALASVMVAAIWQMTGFFVIILLTGLQNIPSPLYEAASIDGAKAHNRFWRITLPLLRPSIFLCSILGVIASFGAFDLIFTMTGGGPGRATELLITYIYKKSFTLSQFDYAAAMTVVMFVLFVVLAGILNRLSGGDAGKVDIAD